MDQTKMTSDINEIKTGKGGIGSNGNRMLSDSEATLTSSTTAGNGNRMVNDSGATPSTQNTGTANRVQPKYGVVDTVQPKYGVVGGTSGPDIDITYNQLEENISTLKTAINNLKSAWSNGANKNIATLNNSWVGPDCSAYTEKLTNMDSKVQGTISALELLCSTYESARDMVKENQKSVLASIESAGK